jgi:glutamate-1-semialdehyde 2,1-aminomutase
MQLVAPLGAMYQAGTLSGNPMAMAAGIATLEELRKPGRYVELERKGQLLSDGIERVMHEIGDTIQFVRIGAIFCLFFTAKQVIDYNSAKTSDTQCFARFFWGMLERGMYLPPSQFEGCFISLALKDEMIDETVEAVKLALRKSLEYHHG